MSASICIGPPCFIVFNDHLPLSDDPIDVADLLKVRCPKAIPTLSMAWSSNVEFFFVAETVGIFLYRVADGEGWFCRKRSAEFIRLFLDAPKRRGKGR